MGGMSMIHWVILLLVIVMIFGTKKLRNMGGDLGAAVKGFKDGMKGDEANANAVAQQNLSHDSTAANTLEAEQKNQQPS